jgi:alpha-methylacyl-CoA racemase
MLDGGAPNYRCYACSDGKFVAVGALEPQFWAALVAGLGFEVEGTPSPYDREQWLACTALLEKTFATKTRDEWAAQFENTDACVAPVLTLEEAPRHPHNVARDSYISVAQATLAAPVPKFSATPAETPGLTEIDGETTALLGEVGFSETEIAELRAAGTIP